MAVGLPPTSTDAETLERIAAVVYQTSAAPGVLPPSDTEGWGVRKPLRPRAGAPLEPRREWQSHAPLVKSCAMRSGLLLATSAVSTASAARDNLGPSLSEVAGIVSVALAVITVFLTVLAIRYARESAVAARDTVRPLQDMSREFQAGTQQLRALLDESKAAVEAARNGRIEDHLIHRLGQYERVILGVQKMGEGRRRQDTGRNVEYFEEARAELQAALSVIPDARLGACRTLADGTFVQNTLDAARVEITNALSRVQAELAQYMNLTDGPP